MTRVRPVQTAPVDPFGSHRTLEPPGALPQPGERLDNDFSRLFRGEMLISVETLNVDAASFRQMEEASLGAGEGDTCAGIATRVLQTVRARGKQQNPVTGSGGMLLGRVLQLTEGRSGDTVVPGDRIATLVSLSLTPLRVDRVVAVHRTSAQVDVEGEAVLFASGAYAKVPGDMPERLALAVLDVAGAAPRVARLVRQGVRSAVILGAGGKSGILCAAEARRSAANGVRLFGVESHAPFARDLRELGLCDDVLELDATDPLAVRKAVLAANRGEEVDLAVSCVNAPSTEMSAILCTRDRGVAYFFAMSTSFTRAALGAEGVSKDIDLMIGNGFAAGHAEHTLDMMRTMGRLRALFERRYSG
jgi:L-erythro-3,5-diaminohexanoate dehydrogenase